MFTIFSNQSQVQLKPGMFRNLFTVRQEMTTLKWGAGQSVKPQLWSTQHKSQLQTKWL